MHETIIERIKNMAVLPILTVPNPILKQVAKPVGKIDDKIRQQMDDMLDTMYADSGIGLAAPQIGISNRIMVLDVEQTRKDDEEEVTRVPMFFINPEIVWESEELNVYNEGCLSLPEMYAEVERPKIVKVKYLDYDGKEQEIEADGLLSTCVQHEIDHLDGVLFVDHLTNLKRNMIMRKLKKILKE